MGTVWENSAKVQQLQFFVLVWTLWSSGFFCFILGTFTGLNTSAAACFQNIEILIDKFKLKRNQKTGESKDDYAGIAL